MHFAARWCYPLLGGLMILAMVMMAKQGLASAFHFKSVFYLQGWSEGEPVNPVQYADAKSAAEKAVSLDKDNPHYLLMLARTIEWGAVAKLDTIVPAEHHRWYQTALSMRTDWADGYAAYAYALAWGMGLPSDAAAQLLIAEQKGPYMPEQLLTGVQLANAYWPELPQDFKIQFFRNQLKLAKAYYPVYQRFVASSRNGPLQKLQCVYLAQQSLTADEYKRLKRDLCPDWQ